jgi:hypothetical protein
MITFRLSAVSYYVNDGVFNEVGSICSAIGASGNTGTSTSSPKATIAQVIAAYTLTTGDIIYVDAGTYTTEANLMNGNTTDFGFTIQGVLVNGVSVSVFDYNGGNANWMVVNRGQTDNITIKNLYIKRYKPTGSTSYGGFIVNSTSTGGDNANSGFNITNCIIDDCDAVSNGGAIYWNPIANSPFSINSTLFKNCNIPSGTGNGGAIYTVYALTMIKCIFYNNSSSADGSAVALHTTSTSTFTNCLFYNNIASGNGTIFLHDLSQTLNMYNCTVANNTKYGVYKSQSNSTVNCNIYNCILYGNTLGDATKAGGNLLVSYSCYGVSNATSTTGSLPANTNPNFTADYHLNSSSPCINTGTGTPGTNPYPIDDLDNLQRVNAIDIGCYEFEGLPLPVKINSLQHICENNSMKLFWSTENELNNDYFTIEKSNDGVAFTELAKVKGSGTTTIEQHYSFIDELKNEGNSYYQLFQTDYNGDKKWVAMEIANCNDINGLINVFPNPNNGQFVISGIQPDMIISIIDVLGRTIYQVTSNEKNQEIYLHNLPSGFYTVKCENKSQFYSRKIVVE